MHLEYFFLENSYDFSDRIRLIKQGKEGGNDSDKVDEETVAIVDDLLEYHCMTATHHKRNLLIFNPL